MSLQKQGKNMQQLELHTIVFRKVLTVKTMKKNMGKPLKTLIAMMHSATPARVRAQTSLPLPELGGAGPVQLHVFAPGPRAMVLTQLFGVVPSGSIWFLLEKLENHHQNNGNIICKSWVVLPMFNYQMVSELSPPVFRIELTCLGSQL